MYYYFSVARSEQISHPVIVAFGRAVICPVDLYIFDVLTTLIVAHLKDIDTVHREEISKKHEKQGGFAWNQYKICQWNKRIYLC